MINTHIEASKIGRQIAVQVLDYHRRAGDSSSGNKLTIEMQMDSKLIFSFAECSPDPENRVPNAANQLPSSGENSTTGNENGNDGRSSLPSQPRINGTISTYNHGTYSHREKRFRHLNSTKISFHRFRVRSNRIDCELCHSRVAQPASQHRGQRRSCHGCYHEFTRSRRRSWWAGRFHWIAMAITINVDS